MSADMKGDEGAPMPILADESFWVECSTCHLAYVVRRGLSFSKGWIWVWSQDCKCKRGGPVIVGADILADFNGAHIELDT